MKPTPVILFLLASLLTFIYQIVSAQDNRVPQAPRIVITGRITNEKGESFGRVSVKAKGAAGGAVSNTDGRYTITVANERAVLIFTHVGFGEQQMVIGSRRTLDVIMKEQAAALNDVVVVAYGKQKQATVTGAVAVVAGKDLVATSVANVSSMLVGNAPGLSGLQSSGEPGRNAANIYIRGISTFAGSQTPLVVIDGIEQAAERPFDQLNSMDANEIDNISVLKDAASTAVYGIRGANGVIIVSTKRGKLGRPAMSFSSSFGWTHAIHLMKDVTSYEYALMRNEAIRTEVSSFGNSSYNQFLFTDDDLWKFQHNRDYTPADVTAMANLTDVQKTTLNASPALYYGSHDILKEQFSNTGPQKQYNLNISGGTSKVKYFTSLGYFSQGSILNNTSYQGASTGSNFSRYNFRSNFDIEVFKNTTVSINLAGEFGNTSGPGANGAGPYDLTGRYKVIMQYIFDANPFLTPGLIQGHLVNAFAGNAGSPQNPLGLKSGSTIGNQNAVYNLLVSGTEKIYNTLLSNSISVRHNMNYLTPGLSIRGTASYDDNYVKTVTFNPSLPVYSVRRDNADPGKLDFFGGAVGSNGFNSNPGHNSVWRKTYFDAGIDYNHNFGYHNITALVLGKASLYTMPSDVNNTSSGIMGLLGRATYNYKERYLAEFDLGYNGTEQFIEGRRFGYFPAYSAGWVISNEDLFPKNEWITFLKIRGSYGEVGNDQIGGTPPRRYLYLPSTFNTGQGGYYFGVSNGSVVNPYYSGTVEGTIGNPAVTWERAKKKNFGVDIRLLMDKLSFTADLFSDRRDNILTNLGTIPSTYGVPSSSVPPVNVGITTNHGYELVLGWKDRVGDLTYFLTGNVNYARNKIIYRAEAPNPYPWMNATGYAIGQYKGLINDGFFNTQKDLDNRPYNTYTSNIAALGDLRYKDINGDGKIDNKDMVPIGFSNLPQYSFSLKAGMSWKGFDLSLLFIGTAKGSFYLPQGMVIPFYKQAGNAFKWEYDGRWTPDKVASGEKITYPRAIMNGSNTSNSFLQSNFWLISNDFKRLKNLEVGYTFNNVGFGGRTGFSAIRIYANGNNLLTWGNAMKEVDPEVTDSGSPYIYPITRVFVVGANVRF
jgi:TonB-linked SusC/RagA family outer membrane protein